MKQGTKYRKKGAKNRNKRTKNSNSVVENLNSVNCLDKCPWEIWELVFDHLGLDLDSAHLTCRLFRNIAGRRRWSHLLVTSFRKAIVPCTLMVTHRHIGEAFEIISAAAAYLNKLTVIVRHNKLVDCDGAQFVRVIKLAMRCASNVVFLLDNETFSSDAVGTGLLDEVKVTAQENKLTLSFIDMVSFKGGLEQNLIQTFKLLESITTSIEAHLVVSELGHIDETEQLMEYVSYLNLGGLVPRNEFEELLQACPRVRYLAAGFCESGHVTLPEHVSIFEFLYSCDLSMGTSELITVSSKFVTQLNLHAASLIEPVSFDFPHLRELLLKYFHDKSPLNERVLRTLRQLTKSLDAFGLDSGHSSVLKQIAPLVCNVKKEIRLLKICKCDKHDWSEYRNYLLSLFEFMACSPKARIIRLQLPLVDSKSMKALIKWLVKRCPGLESLSTSGYYQCQMDAVYPYMHRVSYDPDLDFKEHFRTYEIDLGYIRGSEVPFCNDVHELLNSMKLLKSPNNFDLS
ncbi:hypothetical protein TRVA0_011S02828 [Trichomonascus vanleenenianus]|uniref:uncharacterized protein n=1 Tax=Trichomonascus vanleenenianus TaxID=2268995 RepID=UPI003ECA6486